MYSDLISGSADKSKTQMRVILLQFLDTDIFNVSNDDRISFPDPLIAGWDIDLTSFAVEIVPDYQEQRCVSGWIDPGRTSSTRRAVTPRLQLCR